MCVSCSLDSKDATLPGAEGVCGLLGRLKIKTDNSEFVYYGMSATLCL